MSMCSGVAKLKILSQITGSTAMFNNTSDAVILTHSTEHSIRVVDYPGLAVRESPAAHVGGCVAVALDPRGR
jgi:THO complex subunit 3